MAREMRTIQLKTAIFILFIATLLFASAGTLSWVEGWVLVGLYTAGLLVTLQIVGRCNLDLLIERAQIVREDAQAWDKIISPAIRLLFVGMFVVSGLDERFEWTTSLTLAGQIAAFATGLAGYGLIAWAMTSNRFFNVYTRIQEERGHAVATAGPYRFVRHPGYVGMIILALALPLGLGSLPALAFGGCAAVLFVTKTALEDRTLNEELDGYREYAQRVRYRLLPGVW